MPGGVYCCVYGCINNSKRMPHLSFFTLPKKNTERLTTWIEAIERSDILKKNMISYRVCSVHFETRMFKNKKLVSNAVPTLFLPTNSEVPDIAEHPRLKTEEEDTNKAAKITQHQKQQESILRGRLLSGPSTSAVNGRAARLSLDNKFDESIENKISITSTGQSVPTNLSSNAKRSKSNEHGNSKHNKSPHRIHKYKTLRVKNIDDISQCDPSTSNCRPMEIACVTVPPQEEPRVPEDLSPGDCSVESPDMELNFGPKLELNAPEEVTIEEEEMVVGVKSEPGLKGEVGAQVDSSQADDRRLIRLVRARRLLYARNNLPVASYYSQVKGLWDDVAREMGWSVADVRRKWSHIRNSYSRHLRNEMHGACTSKGRMVSRWYLADELEFLREHMATDMRPSPYSSYAPSFLEMDLGESQSSESVDVKPFMHSPWFPTGAGPDTAKSEPKTPSLNNDDSCSSLAFGADENASYFQFFRGIYNDYQELSAKKQRLFKRKCLHLLHNLLDEEESSRAPFMCDQSDALNLSNSGPGSDEEREPPLDDGYSILPGS